MVQAVINRRTLVCAGASSLAFLAACKLPAAHAASRPGARISIISSSPDYAPFAQRLADRLATVLPVQHHTRPGEACDATPPRHTLVVGGMDALHEQHPGHAYLAGLPGHLGLPFAERLAWTQTLAARAALSTLADTTGLRALPLGVARMPIGSRGVAAAVLRSLGSTPFDRPTAIAERILPYPATVALTMPNDDWYALDKFTRQAITYGAHLCSLGDCHRLHPQPVRRDRATDDVQRAIASISEAVVAELAGHDDVTRRIDASYFAFRFKSADIGRSNNHEYTTS